MGSTRYLLEGGKCGEIVSPADVPRMASAIRRLLTNTLLRERVIAAGLDLARRSTRAKQEEIVKSALARVVPEILGVPDYLKQGCWVCNKPIMTEQEENAR